MRLFLDKGYDATTVEEVAAAAGVSHMTVYRHFPTKEALVLTDEWDALAPAAIRNRPSTEGPLDAVEGAIVDLMSTLTDEDLRMTEVRLSLILSTPELIAGTLFNSLESAQVLKAALRDRGVDDDGTLDVVASMTIAVAGMAAFDWAKQGCRQPLHQILRERFATMRRVVAESIGPGTQADGA